MTGAVTTEPGRRETGRGRAEAGLSTPGRRPRAWTFAAAVALVALLIPPARTAILLVGADSVLLPDVTAGVWIFKAMLLIHAIGLACLAGWLRAQPDEPPLIDLIPPSADNFRSPALMLSALLTLALALRLVELDPPVADEPPDLHVPVLRVPDLVDRRARVELGEVAVDVAAHAGTAFDGTHLFQIAEDRIQKVEPKTGRVLATIPVPDGGASGMAWAEGSLWVGQYRSRKIHQVDPETGTVLRTIDSDRFVTGVTWVDGELWHGTWESDESELRRIDPQSGKVLESVEMPAGEGFSGLESGGRDRFFCGGGKSGKLRAVRRPKRA